MDGAEQSDAPTVAARTVKLVVEYDGTRFAGWQLQGHLPREKTIQGALEHAIEQMTHAPTRVRAASRTDAGVHARGQVVVFETRRESIPIHGFERGISSYLPDSIVVRRAELVPAGWDPRRQSRGKRYRYIFWNDRRPTALDRHRAWWVKGLLDLSAMREGAAVLVGTHDFEAFRSSGCEAKHAVRTLYAVEVEEAEYQRVYLEVIGNAFVRNMVRIIAGNLAAVGLGRMSPATLREVLEGRDRTRGAMTAPAHGLCLEEVIYDDRLPARPADDVDLGDVPGDD